MGANQSHQIPATQTPNNNNNETTFSSEGEYDGNDPNNNENQGGEKSDTMPLFPLPTGHEYDAMDKLQAELPSMIDEESQQQVDDYRDACNDGKGPMVSEIRE